MSTAQPGDTVLLIAPDKKRFIERLAVGGSKSTHHGILLHDDIIGKPLGRIVESHNGKRYMVLRPSMEELLISTQRETQIVYPKDIGYILLKLSIIPGARVIEAGSGSGALTTALARYVWPGGQVYTYETRRDMFELTARNLARTNLAEAVTQHHREIGEDFDERDADALFLDVREPWLYLDQVVRALADGAFFGSIVPTANQVTDLLYGFRDRPFVDIEVAEVLLRQYKPVPARLRPMDHLMAHTGYLVFARKVAPGLAVEGLAATDVGDSADVPLQDH
jgi:tRNA (adenine57-N1/adenine58-N1)-methyltransferase